MSIRKAIPAVPAIPEPRPGIILPEIMPPPPVRYARMVRVLVYEGPYDWIRTNRAKRSVKESRYEWKGKIVEQSITVEDMTEEEAKRLQVELRLVGDAAYLSQPGQTVKANMMPPITGIGTDTTGSTGSIGGFTGGTAISSAMIYLNKLQDDIDNDMEEI